MKKATRKEFEQGNIYLPKFIDMVTAFLDEIGKDKHMLVTAKDQ